jgi:hypothetical protein
MQNNPSTDNTDDTDDQARHLDIDRGDWELAFKPYEGHPSDALGLGFHLAILRSYLETQLFKPRPVLETLDLAMEALFPFTDFHKASFELFLKFMNAKITLEEEQMLRALGIKF